MALAGAVAPARAEEQGWSRQPTSSSEVDSLACSPRLFVGVRGSGERAPFGPTVEAFRAELARRVPGATRTIWLDYPAVSPHTLATTDLEALLLERERPATQYFASVEAGRAELVRVLASARRRCPDQDVVLVGFSQGAQVITEAFSSGADRSRVKATLLVGNPNHYPGQDVRELDGQVDTPAIGLTATMTYLRARALRTEQTDHRTAVHNLVAEVFALYEGTVTTAQMSTTLSRTGAIVPVTGYASTLSLCASGDLVCDAAPPLSRILASSSTLTGEFERTRPVHGGYLPTQAPRTMDEMARLLTDSPEPGVVAPSPAEDGPNLLVRAVMALPVAGLVGGLWWLSRRRRRRAGGQP